MFGTMRAAVLGLLASALGLAQGNHTYQFISLSPQSVVNGEYTPVNLANYTPANQTPIGPIRLAVDASGGVYFTESNDIRKITPQGLVVPIAGFIGAQFASDGDGGPALLAGLNDPYGIAIDAAGNIWVEDSYDAPPALRRITPDGVIRTVGQYTAYGLAVDVNGNVYVPAQALYKIAPDGTVTQYPNTSGGTIGGQIYGLAADASGNVYAANSRYHLVLKITPGGEVTTFAGTGVAGTTGDGGPATSAELDYPYGVALDAAGNIYVADYEAGRIRKIAVDGTITTVAGGGGAFGNGVPATQAAVPQPTDVAVDSAGNLYIAAGLIYEVTLDGVIHTIAGLQLAGCCGDGGPVSQATFGPKGLARDAQGNVYVADQGQHKIRKIAADLTVTTLAGTGQPGFPAGSGPATAATLNGPNGVGVDSDGNVYIADTGNNLIRMVTPDGTIQTIAGDGRFAFAGDGGPAVNASVNNPCFVLPDGAGNIWIADTNSHRIRRISPSGVIETVAGNGTPGFAGDGGPATAAELSIPNALALDAAGNLYIADPAAETIRKVSASGIITTFAGTPGVLGYTGDGGPATSAQLWSPYGVAVDPNGNVLIADSGNNAIRLVMPNGMISSVQPADNVLLPGQANALAVDAGGGFYFASGSIGYAFQGAYPLPPLAPFVPWVSVQNAGFSATADLSGLGGAVAPGMIAAIYGNQLGPDTGVSATVDSNGTVGSNLAGVQVFFNGIAAPVLYAQSGQINVVAPFEIAGTNTVQVYTEYNGLRSNVNTLPVLPTFPGLFPISFDQVAAINQDGTINSSANPAPVGSVVAVFATGGGVTNPVEADGTLVSGRLPTLAAPVQAKFQYQTAAGNVEVDAPVFYAGPAPTLVAGALQVNVQVPAGPASSYNQPTLILYVGGASAWGSIYTQ